MTELNDLRVELNEKEVFCGDTISGKIFVFLEKGYECRGLFIKIQTSILGRKSPRSKNSYDLHVEQIFDGTLKVGKEHVFDFTMTVPEGEPTVEGELIRRIWLISAELDLKSASDLKAESEFEVLPSKNKNEIEINLREESDYSERRDVVVNILLAAFGYAALLAVMGFVYIWTDIDGEVFIGISALYIAIACVQSIRSHIRMTTFGALQIKMPYDIMALGETGEVELILKPKKEWFCQKLTFTLFSRGWLKYQAANKSSSSQSTKDLYQDVLYTQNNVVLEGNKENTFICPFEIPKNQSPSIDDRSNTVNWFIKVECVDKNNDTSVSKVFFWVVQPSLKKEI